MRNERKKFFASTTRISKLWKNLTRRQDKKKGGRLKLQVRKLIAGKTRASGEQ